MNSARSEIAIPSLPDESTITEAEELTLLSANLFAETFAVKAHGSWALPMFFQELRNESPGPVAAQLRTNPPPEGATTRRPRVRNAGNSTYFHTSDRPVSF